MTKKLLLALTALGLVFGAYYFLAENDRPAQSAPDPGVRADIQRFIAQPTTAPTNTITQGNMKFSPGDNTRFRVYDEVTNRLKYVFEADKWEPVSDTRFRVIKLTIEIYTPKGQITYIRADESEVDMVRNARGLLDPKRGFVKGNVQVVMDRTTLDWREAHPDLAAADAHPDQLIRIWLDEARFDMDLAELNSDSSILIDSADTRIERVAGLTLQWNQIDNRVDSLKFRQGGLMKLRRGGRMIDFGLPGTQRDGRVAANTPGPRVVLEPAKANEPMSLETVTAEVAAKEIRIEAGAVKANEARSLDDAEMTAAPMVPGATSRSAEQFAADVQAMKSEARLAAAGVATQPSEIVSGQKGKKKIDTYRAVFTGQVVVEQSDGMKTIGKIEAERLEINFDFGRKQKEIASADRPRPAQPNGPFSDPTTTAPADTAPPIDADDKTRLTLSWNGPMELRPIQVDAAIQTGDRFDAIANGLPVRVQSERGDATCTQLVYRHERKQVWLSGTEKIPADMGISKTRRLTGREVFFDQQRGVARVDGAGSMIDSRTGAAGESDVAFASFTSPREGEAAPAKAGKPRDPVTIRWARGVDIEIGSQHVDHANPSTGQTESKRREFLRRAWFHGDVSVVQGKHSVAGDELAVTFGIPVQSDDVTSQIEHIDVIDKVRLNNDKDFITADRLDVQMTQTPEGRSIARVADAKGHVLAKQGALEFRADLMHVMLSPTRGDSKLGIQSLDATGDVQVFDPDTNLKISRCASLQATMNEGNQLASATIVSKDPATLARVRYGDFAVHGPRVEIDAIKEIVLVPSAGKSWMVTRQDLNGRKLQRPTAVKTTWDSQMVMNLGEDYGVFLGNVHSLTDTFAVDCDKLTVRFMPVPPGAEAETDGSKRFWWLGAIEGDKAKVRSGPTQPLAASKRKRPASVVADGHAVAITSNYAPSESEDHPGRLLSRLRASGEQLAADLRREEMWIPAAGSLLIEDYQFETANTARLAKAAVESGPLMSSMHRDGPSQTAITWQNSMKYFVDQNFVAFDRDVQMVHRSGQQMVLQKELAEAMRLDEKLVHLAHGRRATLACEHLIIEFLTKEKGPAKPKASLTGESQIRATDLHRLIAKGAVHLQEGGRSLIGSELTYLNDSQDITLEGSSSTEAQIFDQDESGQTLNMWRGPRLLWNRATNRVDAPGATIRREGR